MKLTTDEAFNEIKKAGITQNRFVFLKMVREGKIYGRMASKKKGYRFEQSDVLRFIEQYQLDDEYDMGEELAALQRENHELKKTLKMPKDFWIRENIELTQLVQKKDSIIRKLEKELHQLKDDKTIRIRVE